ncbi:MAG: hypothetical protein N2444_06115 [Methylocystis sp.]|nr:hypothetical protein [Methylocystis sp.]
MRPDAGDRRIVAQWRDDPTEARIAIDARVAEGRIVATWDLFGAVDLDGEAPRPFILRRDGVMEFGGGASWRTDLREAEIRVGAQFIVWFNNIDIGVYRIVKIAALGAKDKK